MLFYIGHYTNETVAWRCSVKKTFLKLLQYFQEKTLDGILFSQLTESFPKRELIADVFCNF